MLITFHINREARLSLTHRNSRNHTEGKHLFWSDSVLFRGFRGQILRAMF